MVGLISMKNDEKTVCGAVIISKYKVLTAAHCVYQKNSVHLIFGTLDINEGNYIVKVSKDEIIQHPDFNGEIPYVNNIAVIELKRMINFGRKVGEIAMVEKDYKLGEHITITALGYEKSTPDRDSYLRYVESIAEGFRRCQYTYRTAKEETEMCFGLDDGWNNTISTYGGGEFLW